MAQFIDTIALLAWAALTIDILLQIFRIHKTKSSKDVSIKGSLLRLTSAFVILIKFISIQDTILIIGHSVFMTALITYFVMLNYYKK